MSRPFQASRPSAPTCTTSGWTRTSHTACVSMRRFRRAGAPARKAWLVTASSTGSSGARVHLTGASAIFGTAKRCQPLGEWRYSCRFSASATIMSMLPRSQALSATATASVEGNTERAAASRPIFASTPASAVSNCAVVSAAAAPAAAGAPAWAACRCCSSSRVRCASWCSLSMALRRESLRISAAQANDGLPSKAGPQMHHRLA